MKTKNSKRFQVDLGLLAMPLFCSLLGAILILVFSGAMQNPPPPLPREKVRALLQRIELARLSLARSASLQGVISNRLDLEEYRWANASLDEQISTNLAQIAELTNQVTQEQVQQGRLDEIRRRAAAAVADAEASRERIADLEARINAAKTNAAVGLFGNYQGSLVLLECDSGGVTVHPGGRRLLLDTPEREFDPVFEDIERAGFVALVARPGAFEKSYDHISYIVKERLETLNQVRAKPIGFCAFPLEANADITEFLPKGVTQ